MSHQQVFIDSKAEIFHASLSCPRAASARHWCAAAAAHKSRLSPCRACGVELGKELTKTLGSIPSGARRGLGLPRLMPIQGRAEDVGPDSGKQDAKTVYGSPDDPDDPRFSTRSSLDWGTASYGDLILDGADNFATRYLVNDAAALAHKPYVWGSIQRFCGQVSVFWEDAPDGLDGGPGGLNYRDLYPEPPPAGTVPSCAEGGVLGVLCGSIAAVMGTEAIKLITGIGESLLGRLLIYDALAMSYRTITLRRDPGRPPITGLADYEALCGVDAGLDADADPGLTPAELRGLLDAGAAVALIDVREPGEWEINRIDGARHIPISALESPDGPDLLPPGIPVLYCKTGIRSARVLAALRRAGVTRAQHLQGGIVAWAQHCDPDMAMY